MLFFLAAITATQLEVLDDAELKHECVLFPVSLDEALMEGRYNKVGLCACVCSSSPALLIASRWFPHCFPQQVLDAMQSAPSKYFSNLVDSLKGTVR